MWSVLLAPAAVKITRNWLHRRFRVFRAVAPPPAAAGGGEWARDVPGYWER